MSRPYIIALEAAGAAPILLPLALGEETLKSLFTRLDGLFLAGGGDLNPACYARAQHAKTEGIDSLRDETELLLTKWALDTDLPILGVCRGIQTLNVAGGGTLLQDVVDLVPNAIRHQYFPDQPREFVAHGVKTLDDTRLNSILGPLARVNSFHHQAVDNAAPGFAVAAVASDGVIEAIELTSNRFVVGVQWHPESLITFDQSMFALFETFVQAA